MRLSLSRGASMRSRTGALSKLHEVSHLQAQYEGEITELRSQVAALELKNKKYLEIIGMTASEHQQNTRLQIEAAQEALNFSKRAKAEGIGEHEIQILEELEEMLEAQQKEMQTYQDQISLLSKDLEGQQQVNAERQEVQHRAFEALKTLEAAKAQVDDEL